MDALATTQRRTAPTLATKLVQAPHKFEFDQAFRILEGLHPENETFGHAEDPRIDPLFVRTNLSAETPASDIKSIKAVNDNWDRFEVTMNIMGLVGHHGPLPQPFSNILYDQERNQDNAPRDFIDIFNTRIASQWFRVHTKFRQGLSSVSPDLSTVGRAIINLAGLESKHLRDKLSIPDYALIGYAPLFWQRPRSLVGLRQILNHYFGLNTKLTPMAGGWHKTPNYQHTHISGPYNKLGQDAYLGKQVWLQNSGFRVNLGELDWSQYCNFLPPNNGYNALADLIKFYCGFQYRIIFVMQIRVDKVPGTRLNRGYALGQTTWLKGYSKRLGTFRRVLEFSNGNFSMSL